MTTRIDDRFRDLKAEGRAADAEGALAKAEHRVEGLRYRLLDVMGDVVRIDARVARAEGMFSSNVVF